MTRSVCQPPNHKSQYKKTRYGKRGNRNRIGVASKAQQYLRFIVCRVGIISFELIDLPTCDLACFRRFEHTEPECTGSALARGNIAYDPGSKKVSGRWQPNRKPARSIKRSWKSQRWVAEPAPVICCKPPECRD